MYKLHRLKGNREDSLRLYICTLSKERRVDLFIGVGVTLSNDVLCVELWNTGNCVVTWLGKNTDTES